MYRLLLLLSDLKSLLPSNPVPRRRRRHASLVPGSLPVLLLGRCVPRLVLQSLLQLFLNLLPRLHLPHLTLIPRKRNSVFGNKRSLSRKRNASRVYAALKKRKERNRNRGNVKRLLVGRESWKRKCERQSRNV
jgi:hypothetical protein